ncbi:MAG: Unknown protein [uncultured Campylobacterales bacterium]|uniref:Uncharacterized protein n=1 Tax=uncultured Campylobacterales bacterium TaxID=352960 RepID=A0A6S6S2L8_9BACT|nr:MAG: Unknown protein [uncultured Campylobacterales bacterium]
MAEAVKELKHIDLDGSKNGEIVISHIDEPYGEGSHSVVSIGITLRKGSKPAWKAHIPYENLDEVIEALQAAAKAQK